MARSDLTGPLVGRARELATLLAALDRAAAGEPGAVLVAGDAGVGKTRRLRRTEAVSLAHRAGLLAG